MPFDPNSPFDSTDPSQWWRLQNLPHILIQPNAPPNAASGGTEDDGLPNDWFVPEADGFPNDWIRPDNNAPTPTPSAAAPPPSPQPNPAAANRSLEHLDPYYAFWSQMPASRAGAMAWHPPIFLSPDPSTWLPPTPPNAFGQFPPGANAFAPDFGLGGIPGGFGRAIAEQARANNPWAALANDVLGGNPKMAAPSASSDPMSLAAFGSFANLQLGAANAAAAASLPMSLRFLPSDPIGFQGARNFCGYAGNDPLNSGDTTGFAARQPAIQTTPPISAPLADASGSGPSDPDGASDTPAAVESQYYRRGQAEGFPTQPSPDVSLPPVRLVNESNEEEEKFGSPFPDVAHLKSDPSLFLNPFGERNSIAGRMGWGAGTPGTALVPYRAGPLSAPPQAPQSPTRVLPPPFPRPASSPPASTPPAALPPPSPGRAATSPRTFGAPAPSELADTPGERSESDAGNRAGAGAAPRGPSSPMPIGRVGRSTTSSEPDWPKLTDEIADALITEPEKLPEIISARLPKYDNVTTYGVLMTNEGDVVPLRSGGGNPLYGNYSSAGHVEGKAAIWIRENGSSGGVLYQTNPGGTCGRCNGQIRALLPEGARLRVVSPEDAVPKNKWARVTPPEYEGSSAPLKPPKSRPLAPQPDFFDERQP
jgi:hypothetical protein